MAMGSLPLFLPALHRWLGSSCCWHKTFARMSSSLPATFRSYEFPYPYRLQWHVSLLITELLGQFENVSFGWSCLFRFQEAQSNSEHFCQGGSNEDELPKRNLPFALCCGHVFLSVTPGFDSFRKGYLACLMPIVLPHCPFWTADRQWWYHLSLEWPCFHIAVSPCVPRVSFLSPLPNAFFFKTPLSLLVVSVANFLPGPSIPRFIHCEMKR